MTKQADNYIKRQTAHRVIKVAMGDISQLIDAADGETVAVPVGKLERIENALGNALTSLIGT